MKSFKEIFDLRHRKALRIGVLALFTLLITSASALTYYSLTASTSATTSAATVKFISAADTPTGTVINAAGTFVTLPIKAYPNATLTYQFALNISNTDASNAHSVRLRSVSIASGGGSYSNSTSKIEFDLMNTAGAQQTFVRYTGANGGAWTTTGSPTAYFSIAANTKWTIQIITSCDATASTGVTTSIQLAVDVQ